MKNTRAFRMDDELFSRLCKYSKGIERSAGYVVSKALEQYLGSPENENKPIAEVIERKQPEVRVKKESVPVIRKKPEGSVLAEWNRLREKG